MAATGLNDYELFRACGPLYPAFAIESLTSLLLGLFFCYLALRIVVRTDVKKPLAAGWLMFHDYVSPVMKEWWKLMLTWPDMNKKPLTDRITYCRNLNIAMCLAQALAAFFSVFRWLHISNVNGLRYLGYAFTCSLMQAELVVLIAPYVPCYRINVVFIVIFTHLFLISGWIGSMHAGFLFSDASWELFKDSWQPEVLEVTNKGVFIGVTACSLTFLCVVQMPLLLLCYLCAGGYKAHRDLPYKFLPLLCSVWFTWPAFPCWWLLSAEGLGLLSDAKSNAVGFAILNCISKGSFTLAMLRLGADHKKRWPEIVEPGSPKVEKKQSWLVRSLQTYESEDPKQLQEKLREKVPKADGAKEEQPEPSSPKKPAPETLWV